MPLADKGKSTDQSKPSSAEDQQAAAPGSDFAVSKGKQKAEAAWPEKLRNSTTMAASALLIPHNATNQLSTGSKDSMAGPSTQAHAHRDLSVQTQQPRMGEVVRSPVIDPYKARADADFANFVRDGELLPPNLPPLAIFDRPQDTSTAQVVDGQAVLNILDLPPQDSAMLGIYSSPTEDSSPMLADTDKLYHALHPMELTLGHSTMGLLDWKPEALFGRFDEQESIGIFGEADPATAQRAWASMWSQVLSVYNDEVWGELTPLVHAAQQEAATLAEDPAKGNIQGARAIERLRQLVGHLKVNDTKQPKST